MEIELAKNRERDSYSFANINLLGKCNVDCFFCLGKDIADELGNNNQLSAAFLGWKNFTQFLAQCKQNKIKKLYITGQNTDSLLYCHLDALIAYLRRENFDVGLRTNGFLALAKMQTINKTNLSVGYSIHSLNPDVNFEIMKRRWVPDWRRIITSTERPRISVVVNRYNESEIESLLDFFSEFPNIRYVQMRRVSTDRRVDELMPDIEAYERIYHWYSSMYPMTKLFADAEIYSIKGHDVVFWRTVRTSVNSMNYFTDGTISDMYFVVEGYLKYKTKGYEDDYDSRESAANV